MNTSLQSSEAINSELDLFKHYRNAKYSSVKHDSYFQCYEHIFRKYVGQKITFVEIGILNGGSLFMWREYFGPSARIIGIELNPLAKKWEEDGFEIFIGSQSDPDFWDNFYEEVGPIDILLDDGGHTNTQQIVTTHKAIANINDGGTLVVEDVHASYLTKFGNPSRYSFVNFAKRIVDSVNSRFPAVNVVSNDYGKKVFSVSFFESIVVFHIDSRRCFTSSRTSNDGVTANAESLRYEGTAERVMLNLQARLAFTKGLPLLWRVERIFPRVHGFLEKWESRKLKRLFR